MRVHPSYWIPGAETGRWSSSSPNLQQVPKDLRRLYIAEDDHVFVGADYKSLELYTLAHCMVQLGIRGSLLEALNSGEDVHTLTARLMGEGISRQDAKMASFGLGGGMGVLTLLAHARRQGADWTLQDARRVRVAWFRAYPDVAEYLRLFDVDVYRDLKPEDEAAQDWLEDLDFDPEDTWPSHRDIVDRINEGRVYRVGLPTGRVLPHRRYSSAANSFFQGLGADVITTAFVECCRGGLEPCAVVHDSITVGSPVDTGVQTGEALVTIMQAALQSVCPSVRAPRPEYTISRTLK